MPQYPMSPRPGHEHRTLHVHCFVFFMFSLLTRPAAATVPSKHARSADDLVVEFLATSGEAGIEDVKDLGCQDLRSPQGKLHAGSSTSLYQILLRVYGGACSGHPHAFLKRRCRYGFIHRLDVPSSGLILDKWGVNEERFVT